MCQPTQCVKSESSPSTPAGTEIVKSVDTGKETGDARRIRFDHLPKLPKDSVQRFKLLQGAGSMNLERRMYEAYLDLLEVNKQNGLSKAELYAGPSSFQEIMNELRPQVEAQRRGAEQRFHIAKRVAGSLSQSSEKTKSGLEILQREAEALKVATQACEVYRLMEHLWSIVLARVRSTIDEQEICKSINAQEMFEVKPPREQLTIPQQSLALLTPHLGVYSPLPRDSITQLLECSCGSEDLQYVEEVYIEMRGLCQSGCLCTHQVMRFEALMQKERRDLQKALPGRERILRCAAYNRVVTSFKSSTACMELDLHKIWRLKTNGQNFEPRGADRISGPGGQHLPSPFKEDMCPVPGDGYAEDQHVTSSALPLEHDQASLREPHDGGEILGEGLKASDEDGEELDEAELGDFAGICVSCIAKQAVHVLQKCGHLVYCSSCRRKVVATQLNAGEEARKSRVKPAQLRNKELQRTKVGCPICREEGVLVAREKFEGRIFPA